MDQDPIDIITVNNSNSTEIKEPAGAAVGEAFNAHEGSDEADSRMGIIMERHCQYLVEAKGLAPTKINLWKAQFESFSENRTNRHNAIYKMEEEIRSIKNEIYQVVGFFSAFQGLLITAAAQSSLLRCNNVGFILALSAFATAVAVFGISQKMTAMEELLSANIGEKDFIQELSERLYSLRVNGIDVDYASLYSSHRSTRPFRTWWKEVLVSYGTWLVISVIAFGGLCMVAMRQIVCNPGHSLPSNKCIPLISGNILSMRL